MQIQETSKQDTLIFKAIGILLIVFHNYFHWVAPNIEENEFFFSSDVIKSLFAGIMNTPSEMINLFFDCFGYYGVQVFIFISGVGLAVSMIKKPINYCPFMLQRLKKIYAMLIVAIVFFYISLIVLDGFFLTYDHWKSILWKFLLINTLLPDQALSINGPWWFFGLIFQLYLLFPLLFKIIKKYNLKGLIAICLFSFLCTYIVLFLICVPEGFVWMANSIAHLPEFAFGLFIAMNREKKISVWVFISAFIVFALGNTSKLFFPLTFLSITILLYFLISKMLIFIKKSNWLTKVLLNVGTLSMAIFITHAVFRTRFISNFSENWHDKIVGALLFFITIYAISIVANIFYKWVYNLFGRISKVFKTTKSEI